MRFGDDRDWFFQHRFGMFLHWGLYALGAWQEQHQWRKGVPRREYVRLAERFNPLRFDPDQWLDLAQEAGMQYVCITTKHHDGFCLFDSSLTDYKVTNTPYKKDVIGMLADACHARDVPLCLYYSVVDWHHPSYPNQGRTHELTRPEPRDTPDEAVYLEYLRGQVRELCSNYGAIHGFWWDLNAPGIKDPSVNAMIRELQPQAVINNRGFDDGDFGTPERDMDGSVDEVAEFQRPTEACQSVGRESWGFKEDEDYYSDRHLIASLDKVLAKGGNYLLNLGPRADGTIPDEAAAIVRRVGQWYRRVREAFGDAAPASAETQNRDVLLTRRANVVYVHLHREPQTHRVLLNPMREAPLQAVLLNTGQAVECRVDTVPTLVMDSGGLLIEGDRSCLRLRGIPVNELATAVPVIKLTFS